MAELKPCPFCGSTKLKVESKRSKHSSYGGRSVDRYTLSVRCNCCHARGPAFGGLIIYKPSPDMSPPFWATTIEQLEKSTVDAWNKRSFNEHSEKGA